MVDDADEKQNDKSLSSSADHGERYAITINDSKHQRSKCLAEYCNPNFPTGYRSHERRTQVVLKRIKYGIQQHKAFRRRRIVCSDKRISMKCRQITTQVASPFISRRPKPALASMLSAPYRKTMTCKNRKNGITNNVVEYHGMTSRLPMSPAARRTATKTTAE